MQREVATLEAGDRLDVADGIMRLGLIRHLPVVDGDRVIGILSQRDLLRAAVSSLLQLNESSQRDWLAQVPVRAVMTPLVFTIAPAVSVRAAVRVMLEKRIGCLPVVENGKLVGLLSETDCLRALAHLMDLDATRAGLPEIAPE